jgi:hypothetical protein
MMISAWPKTIVCGQAGADVEMAEIRPSQDAKSDRVLGQFGNDQTGHACTPSHDPTVCQLDFLGHEG